eukprot:77724_1
MAEEKVNDVTKKKKKKKMKWDKQMEARVIEWINEIMGKKVISGKLYSDESKNIEQNVLGNGQLLCRVINKLKSDPIDTDVIKRKPNDSKYDEKRISEVIKCIKQELDKVNDGKDVFEVNDLMEGRNMMKVLDTLDRFRNVIQIQQQNK